MFERLLSNGARTILVESPDRFARDRMVQLAGHDMLKTKGITLIAASAPTHHSPLCLELRGLGGSCVSLRGRVGLAAPTVAN
jgi:DNA invertase Pin-like site-specific DNA recombinase